MSSQLDIAKEALEVCNRRSFVRRASLAGLAGAIAPAAASLFAPRQAQASPTPSPELDVAILNFALNLEYLEAQYYLYATTGAGISDNGGTTAGGDGTAGGEVTIKSNPKVPFSDSTVAGYAAEIAEDEFHHVAYLQSALGSAAVAAPDIDLLNSFNGLAQQALGVSSFDPFASDLNFLLGSFIFEDVGVTAYHGAAPLIYTKEYLKAGSAILAVEALHAGEIRSLLYAMSQETAGDPNHILTTVKAISDLRDKVDTANGSQKDQGIYDFETNTPNIYPADANSVAFARTTTQVLRIVYGMASSKATAPAFGTFFPNGANGTIK